MEINKFTEEILKGNYVLASITGMTLTKLAIKLQEFNVADSLKYTVSAEVLSLFFFFSLYFILLIN